jgi:hypothetical protein
VDHKPGRHDDHVVAVALAAQHVMAAAAAIPGTVEVWVPGMTRDREYVGATHRVPSTAII